MDARIEGYAAAIFEIARAEGNLAKVEDELFAVARAFESAPELVETLTDPRLPADRKEAIVDDLIADRASPLTTALVRFIVSLGRSRDLPAIVDAFVAKSAAERKKAVAEVRSAIPLDEATLVKLEHALSAATGKQVEAEVVVDPTVIGGISATVGDVVIDGTVRHRLESLREALQSR